MYTAENIGYWIQLPKKDIFKHCVKKLATGEAKEGNICFYNTISYDTKTYESGTSCLKGGYWFIQWLSSD